TQFVQQIDNNNVASVNISAKNPPVITGKLRNGSPLHTVAPFFDDSLLPRMLKHDVEVTQQPADSGSILWKILLDWLPFLIFIGMLIWFMRQMQSGGGGRGAMSFGRSRARMQGEDQVKVTFADVAGCQEAKDEVGELVEFLRDPSKFQKLGGRIPSGVLLAGPPGTGKTLLAKAIAGEAKVPFFIISGSDFVEMFVGVGASRVRDMFEQAKKQAPCIIFIDEIDAVGRHRGAGLGGGHDEREQTLNQLLVEMDGFEGNEGVIVIAATNRADVLDPALLRPGRFDRQVIMILPDLRGREQILKVHMRKVPLAKDVDARILARGTPGFSGADLANLINEAALFSARDNLQEVTMNSFERAKDKIMMGAERRSMIMTEDEKRLTAFHESGHAIVGLSVPGHDPVHKVTIIPRGQALGVTMFLPEQDRYSHSREELESRLASLFGGRVAEELIFGGDKVTTGASNDIQRATQLARDMVIKYGLSEEMGPMTYGEDEDEVFLGRSITQHKHISEATARRIDEVVRNIVDRTYGCAYEILKSKLDILHAMAAALMQYETIDREQIAAIMAGREPAPPSGWHSADEDQGGSDDDEVKTSAKAKDQTGGVGEPASQH
ncbi:MAG TPA: ATP-dependent metallopeptidase FtsH/Yme1/Tma family protein, partial [Mizugakiibacter sp.]|nr:ATP-dependent metallopeptidase FtsH/Yme1/Tma family protein [Mizugakiibacter sp.]